LDSIQQSANTEVSPAIAESISKRQPQLRLAALDGIRGLAALYVVYFHVGYWLRSSMDKMSTPLRILNHITIHGHSAVVAFIVLSGFVLMLPVVRATSPFQITEYFRRRAKRILPPYFAALIICLLGGLAWHLVNPAQSHPVGENGAINPFLENPTITGVLSHFVLLHNLKRSWVLVVDSPMWTVATEWQIYFFFPLVLLPLWRRFGMATAVAAAVLLGLLPVLLRYDSADMGTWCPWFLGLFAVGMAAAELAVSPRIEGPFKSPRLWGIAAAALFAVIILGETRLAAYWDLMGMWAKDLLDAGVVALLLVYLARAQLSERKRQPLLARFLESRLCVLLGAFSYSLYLTHVPLLNLIDIALRAYISGKALVMAMFVLAPMLTVIGAYCFHLAFETPQFSEYCMQRVKLIFDAFNRPEPEREASTSTFQNSVLRKNSAT
jgi:peptidoglycan/LPS O-acetylase OafA/YrhL